MAHDSMSDCRFLVYILRRSDRHDPYDYQRSAPFYVGKGNSARPAFHLWEARNTKKSTRKLNIIRAVEQGGGVIMLDVVAQDIQESIAFIIERQLIHFYGRDDQGGLLANRTDGGEGPSGMAEESRQRISASKRGKKRSPETIAKLRKAGDGFRHTEAAKIKCGNTRRGKTNSPEHRQRISAGLRASAATRKPQVYSLERRQKLSRAHRGRVYGEEVRAKRRGERNVTARPVIAEGQRYSTVREAAAAVGISQTTLLRRLRRHDSRYSYVPGTEAIGEKRGGIHSPSAQPLLLDGIRYASVQGAIDALGIGRTTFYRRLRRGVYVRKDIDL